MSNTTATATLNLAAIESGYRRRGPWASTYEVNLQTLAVNVAQRGNAELDDLGPDDTALACARAARKMLLAGEAHDAAGGTAPRSIDDFWSVQLLRLQTDAYTAVLARAKKLLEAHRGGRYADPATDLYEMFDGQR